MKTLSFIVLATSLTACSSYGLALHDSAPAPSAAPEGSAKVCVLRDDHFPAPLYKTVVHDNEKLVGATKNESYFCYFAEPGHHDVRSEGTYGDESVAFDAAPNGTYYLKQSWLVPAVRGHELSWVEERAALRALAESEYAMLDEVPSNERLPGAYPFAPAKHAAAR